MKSPSRALSTTYRQLVKLLTRPCLPSSYILPAGLLTTWGATIPMAIPVLKPPMQVQSIKMSQNSGSESTAMLQTVKSGDSGSISKQLYTYMHSGNTKEFYFWALAEALTASRMKMSSPFKQPRGSDGVHFARISVIPFEEVSDDEINLKGMMMMLIS